MVTPLTPNFPSARSIVQQAIVIGVGGASGGGAGALAEAAGTGASALADGATYVDRVSAREDGARHPATISASVASPAALIRRCA